MPDLKVGAAPLPVNAGPKAAACLPAAFSASTLTGIIIVSALFTLKVAFAVAVSAPDVAVIVIGMPAALGAASYGTFNVIFAFAGVVLSVTLAGSIIGV